MLPKDMKIEYFELLKAGEDILDESGNVIYRCKDLTNPPKKSRSYAFCSDTGYDPGLVEHLTGLDMIYHETTFLEEKEKWARKTFHSTTRDAAVIARDAGVKKLLIGHFSARYRDIQPFVDECRNIFPESYPAEEGKTYLIKE